MCSFYNYFKRPKEKNEREEMNEVITAGKINGSYLARLHSVQVGARSLCSQCRGGRQKICREGTCCESFSLGMTILGTGSMHCSWLIIVLH